MRIENLAPTNGTAQTPHWVGFHDGVAFDIYDGGTAANSRPIANSDAVERLAEDGNAEPLSEDFATLAPNGIDDVIAGANGPLLPGDSGQAAFLLDPNDPQTRYFSYASMVLPSNDFWYANGNPKSHPIFDQQGNFIAENFIVTRDAILDAGTEINDEIPENTAFFGQAQPNSGLDEGGVIRDFEVNDPETFFMRPGSGGILDDARFRMADFRIDGYPLVKISFEAVPAITEKLWFFSTLSGREEVPPVRTPATGLAVYALRGEGTRLFFQHYLQLRSNAITAAHLHLGKPGENGPVVAALFNAENRNDRLRGGHRTKLVGELTIRDLTGPLEGLPLDSLIAEILDGNVYVNIHTRRYPDGQLRGQISSFDSY